MGTLILILHGRLLFQQLDVPFIGQLQLLQVFVHFSELVCVLLEPLLQFLIDVLLPASLLLLFELLHTFCHALASLLWSFLHGHDFLLVGAIFFEQHLCQFLPK